MHDIIVDLYSWSLSTAVAERYQNILSVELHLFSRWEFHISLINNDYNVVYCIDTLYDNDLSYFIKVFNQWSFL